MIFLHILIFHFSSHKKAMKYRNPATSKIKYGDEKKYHYSFYWKQAMSFYKAAKTLPMESVPLVSYYSMLNAVKAFLAFKCDYIEDFVEHFSRHGLFENTVISGNELSTIHVGHQNKVFLFCLEECLSRTLILFGQVENQIQLH